EKEDALVRGTRRVRMVRGHSASSKGILTATGMLRQAPSLPAFASKRISIVPENGGSASGLHSHGDHGNEIVLLFSTSRSDALRRNACRTLRVHWYGEETSSLQTGIEITLN